MAYPGDGWLGGCGVLGIFSQKCTIVRYHIWSAAATAKGRCDAAKKKFRTNLARYGWKIICNIGVAVFSVLACGAK